MNQSSLEDKNLSVQPGQKQNTVHNKIEKFSKTSTRKNFLNNESKKAGNPARELLEMNFKEK